MGINPFVKPVGIVAAELGIVQGLTWFILALFAILIHLEAWEPLYQPPWTHGVLLRMSMVYYLTGAIIISEMAINPFLKPVGTAAAALGIVQGLAWIILALLAILIHLEAWIPEFTLPTTHAKLLKASLVEYLTVVDNEALNIIITSNVLFGWSVVYFIISLFWIGISSVLLWAIIHEKYGLMRKILIAWAGWTGLICLCDLILTILLGLDYHEILTVTNAVLAISNRITNYAVLACGILMTLTARGFVLWIVNLTFVILLYYLSSNLMKKEEQNRFGNNNTANLFGNVTSPTQGNSNPAFNWQDDKPNFPRSDSFVSPSLQGYEPPPQNYPKPPPKPNVNDRLAKIGKPNGNSPPYNVAPPKPPQNYIYPSNPRVPSPDYSPPNSPYQTPLKSALKNRAPQNPFTFPNNPRY